MATRRQELPLSKALDEGLREYTRVASVIPSVAAIVFAPGPERDLFTYLHERDEEALGRLADLEDRLFELFDDVLFDFHVVYLEGRPLEQMAPTSGKIIYLRSVDA